MGRKYEKTSNRGMCQISSMQNAIRAIRRGELSIRKASATYELPKTTVMRYLQSCEMPENAKPLGRRPILSLAQENELVVHIKDMEQALFGLTTDDARTLVYQYCEMNSIVHPFDQETKQAGWDWLYGVLKRHREISLRSPEPTSLARAVGFNRPQVQKFFGNLGNILDREKIPNSRIFNVDETGYNTIQTPRKVLAPRGKRNVAALTGAERGKHAA